MVTNVGNLLGWTTKQTEIARKMDAIVVAMNDMPMDNLHQMEQEIDRDEAFGPLINPTAWMGSKFEEARMIKTVVRAIIAFKKEVSGIGRFHKEA